MRFGISATSLIVPKNFLTRLRPVNVCAIFSLSIRLHRAARAPLLSAAIHRDHQDRRLGRPVLCDSGLTRTAAHFFFHRDRGCRITTALEFGFPPCSLSPVRDPRFTRAFRYFSFVMAGRARPSRLTQRSSGLARPGISLNKPGLLKLNLCADLLERSLDLVGLVLGHAFLDGLRRALDEVLGFFQAEAGKSTHFLDDFDLLLAGAGEDHGEVSLLF